MVEYSSLREANHARELERDPEGRITAMYRACELGGEIAEFRNCIKHGEKARREELGLPGSRATIRQLADELADVWIACDLLAAHYKISLPEAVERKWNADSRKLKLKTTLRLDAETEEIKRGQSQIEKGN